MGALFLEIPALKMEVPEWKKVNKKVGVIDKNIYAPFVFGAEMGGWKYFDFLIF